MTPQPQWFFARGGQQQQGPVSLDVLRQLLASSQISPGDLVWCEGMGDWQPAGQVQALKIPVAPPVAPNAPPAAQPLQNGYAAQPVSVPYATRPTPYYPSGQSYNGLAIAGFICSFLVPIVGLILSLVALSSMKTSGNFEGRGLAKAGAIISGVIMGGGILLGCLWFIVVAAAIGAGAGH
jgi:hypothetical protein